jgi:hypothetical protein
VGPITMELLLEREREEERESSCVHVCDVVGRGGSRRWEEEPKQLLIVSK